MSGMVEALAAGLYGDATGTYDTSAALFCRAFPRLAKADPEAATLMLARILVDTHNLGWVDEFLMPFDTAMVML